MPRPKNKSQLIEQGQVNYKKLLDFIEGLSANEQNKSFPEGTLNRNIRDVLAHLHAWHLLVFEWYKIGMAGQKPEMPAPGHTWKTTPLLNKEINLKYSKTPLKKVKLLLSQSHQQIMDIINKHTDEALFEKKYYKWTGSTSLAAYLISATSSHYNWGLKLIKRAKK